MKRNILLSSVILLLTLLLGVVQTFGAVTAYYELKLRSATTGQLVPGKNVDLYQSGSKVYDLTESTTVPGVYYYSSVAHGVYDVYVDGSLYKSGVSVIAGTAGLYFDNNGQLTTAGHADSSVTGAKIAEAAVDTAHLSTQTKAYIASTGGLGDFSGLDSLPTISDTDVFAIQAPDSSAPNTITAARFADYVQAEAGAGDITAVVAGEMIAGGSSSGSAPVSVDFLSGTEATSADTNDVVAIQEDGTDNMRYITLENLMKPLTITGSTTNNLSNSGISHAISLTADDIADGISKKMLTAYWQSVLATAADGTAGTLPVSDGLNGFVWADELQWDDVNKRFIVNVDSAYTGLAVGGSMAVIDTTGFVIFIAKSDGSFGNGNYTLPVNAPDSAGMYLCTDSDSTAFWAEGTGGTTVAAVVGLADSLSDHMTLLAAHADSIDELRSDIGSGGSSFSGSSTAGFLTYPSVSIHTCHFPGAGPARWSVGARDDYLIFEDSSLDSVSWSGELSDSFDGSTDSLYLNVLWTSSSTDSIVLNVKMDAIAVDGTADFHSYNYDDSNRISMQGTANKPHLDKLWLENDDTISGGNAFRLLLWRNVNDSADSGTADLHLIAVWLSNGVNGS